MKSYPKLSNVFPRLSMQKSEVSRFPRKRLDLNKCCMFAASTMKLDCTRNYVLSGRLMSFKYFEDIKTEILRQFEFNDTIKAAVKKYFDDIKEKQRLSAVVNVGVHIRRQDYVRWGQIRHGFRSISAENFWKICRYVKENFIKVNKT